MREHFDAFVSAAAEAARLRGLAWDLPLRRDGRIASGHEWDLSAAVQAPTPPRALLTDLGTDSKCVAALSKSTSRASAKTPLSADWQELLKAAVVEQVLVRRNNPLSALVNVVRPLRVLATCAGPTAPWDVTPEIVERSIKVGATLQNCGALASLIEGVVRNLLDGNLLCAASPLLPPTNFRRSRRDPEIDAASTPRLRRHLTERKSVERLPDARALWELVRIVFTERPKTFMDALRFAQVKALLLCGFRIGEACMILEDWRREHEFLDVGSRSSGSAGGLSTSLMVRHMAEKQRGRGEDSAVLFESAQYVPEMFRELLTDALEQVRRMTSPLRARLKAQTTSGRLLPEYDLEEYLTAREFLVRLYGLLEFKEELLPDGLVEAYRASWNMDALDRLREHQRGSRSQVSKRFQIRCSKFRHLDELPLRRSSGAIWGAGDRIAWDETFVRVADCEQYIERCLPTKLSDRSPMRISGGRELLPYDLLFLAPKRSLTEERDGGICDVGSVIAIGRVGTEDLEAHLGGRDGNNLFTRYAHAEDDRSLSLNPHSLRHLQHTELFRLGLADTLIAKRFSPTGGIRQRYEYDHRSLAEDLDAMELPEGAEMLLGPAAQQTLKLFSSGRARGPMIDEFKRIQREQGDTQAFEFLKAEADGFHATPYGFCPANFTVDPCPKHLECFNGCKFLALSPEASHRRNLELMREQLKAALAHIESLPDGGMGRTNQLAHARVRLSNIERAIACLPGDRPFADGVDRSDPILEAPHGTLP